MSDLTTRIAGRRVVASISGGKDSAAMSLWLTDQGIDHDRVFCDTVAGTIKAVGNGVPLPLGRAIARAVARALARGTP